jgi:hypothetical protein
MEVAMVSEHWALNRAVASMANMVVLLNSQLQTEEQCFLKQQHPSSNLFSVLTSPTELFLDIRRPYARRSWLLAAVFARRQSSMSFENRMMRIVLRNSVRGNGRTSTGAYRFNVVYASELTQMRFEELKRGAESRCTEVDLPSLNRSGIVQQTL